MIEAPYFDPRNPWQGLSRAIALGHEGAFDQALRLLDGLEYHTGLEPSDVERVRRLLMQRMRLAGAGRKICGPADFWTNPDDTWLLPFRSLNLRQEAPKPYPPDMVLPELLGQGNDFWYLHQAAASARPEAIEHLALVYVVEDLESCGRFLDSLAGGQVGADLSLLVFTQQQHAEVVRQKLRALNLSGHVSAAPFLSEEGQRLLLETAQATSLLGVLQGRVVLDPSALVRAAHLARISDLAVQPLVQMSQDLSSNTPYAVKSAPYAFHTRYPFCEIPSLNIFVPTALFQRVGGFDLKFESADMAARELAFRCFNRGAYFSPLLVPEAPDAPLNISTADRERFRQRCPNIWDRCDDGVFETPKVSIYIPAYNAGKYIEQAIDSVLGQDFRDLEVCIANDGSRDNTLDVLERNFGSDPRVRWLNLRNGGIGHASNAAISMSRGLYVGQLDSDDRLKPGAVRALVTFLDENPLVACCYGSCERVDAEGGYLQDEYSWLHFSRQKMMITSITHHFRMFRRACWERTGRFRTEIRNAVDYDIFLKLAETGYFHHMDKILYQRRWHGENTSNVNEGFQTANTYRVQREALRRQGLARYWDVQVADPKLPRRVGYKRVANTPRVLFWPNYSRANPYQKLLYHSALKTHEIMAAPIEEAVKVQEGSTEAEPTIFHLHWTNFLFVGAADRVEVRLQIRAFLKELTRFRDLGGRIVWTIHNTLSHDNPYVDLEKGLSRRLVELAEVIHLHSAASVPEVQAVFDIPDYKIRISRHGHYIGVYADYLTPEAARQTLGLAVDEDVILFLGQVRPYKGVGHLVRTFRKLMQEHPRAKLVIAGAVHDDFWSTVTPALTAAERERLLVTDRFLDETELQLFFRAADIAVFPYRNVLTSGSLLLSLSFGVPAVVPRVGMTVELLEGSDAGLLYDGDDEYGLEEALRLALNKKKTGQLKDMQFAALSRAREQTWLNIGDKLFD